MFNFIRLLFLTVSLVGLLLSTNAVGQEKKKTEAVSIKRILSLADPYKGNFRLAIFLSLVLAIVGPIRPKLVEQAVDVNLANRDFASLKITVALMFA